MAKQWQRSRLCGCPDLDCRYKPFTHECEFKESKTAKWLWYQVVTADPDPEEEIETEVTSETSEEDLHEEAAEV